MRNRANHDVKATLVLAIALGLQMLRRDQTAAAWQHAIDTRSSLKIRREKPDMRQNSPMTTASPKDQQANERQIAEDLASDNFIAEQNFVTLTNY